MHHHTMSSTWPDEANQSRGCQSPSQSHNQGINRLMAIATADLLSRLLQDDGGSVQLPLHFRPSPQGRCNHHRNSK